MESNDISKRTVLVLLVLTLVVSVVGTWTVLSQPTTILKTVELGEPQEGRVSLHIGGSSVPTAPLEVSEGGKVSVKILK